MNDLQLGLTPADTVKVTPERHLLIIVWCYTVVYNHIIMYRIARAGYCYIQYHCPLPRSSKRLQFNVISGRSHRFFFCAGARPHPEIRIHPPRILCIPWTPAITLATRGACFGRARCECSSWIRDMYRPVSCCAVQCMGYNS